LEVHFNIIAPSIRVPSGLLPGGFPTEALCAFVFSSMRTLKGPSFLFSGYRSSFSGVKRLAREVNHSRPSSAEVKKEESYTSTPPICLHGVDRDSSAFYMELTIHVTVIAVTDSCNSVRY